MGNGNEQTNCGGMEMEQTKGPDFEL